MRSRDPMMYKSRSKCRCVSDDDKCDGDENLRLFIIEDNLKGDQGGIRKKGVGVDNHKCKNNNKEIRLCLTSLEVEFYKTDKYPWYPDQNSPFLCKNER